MGKKHLHLFGGVWLSGSESKVDNFGTTRSAKLLVLLSLVRSGKMLRSQLAEQLWPDDFYDATRLRLRQEIHRLKRALGEDADLIGSDAKEVWLDKAQLTTDIELLEDIGRGLERLLPETVFTEEFLPGWHDDWVIAERNRAENLQVSAAVAHSTKRLEAGDPSGALEFAKRVIERYPLNEELRMVAVHSNARLGSVAASVAEYQDYRRKVREQLGVETAAPDTAYLAGLVEVPAAPPAMNWENSLPSTLDPIIGRESAISDTLSRLAKPGARLLTLVGPGGIGKTQLSIEVANRLRENGGIRIAFVSLADVGENKEWARATLSQLRSESPTESDPLQYLASVLGQKPTILVLDNAESVLPEAAAGIREVLRQTPSLKILATSVFPLRIEGESLLPVAPLDPLTSGMELLESVLQSVRPQLLTNPETRTELLEIARRLDGYPLAIRLAAARLRLLSPRDLIEQLHELLSSPARGDLADRHRSIELALGSAFSSLNAEQRSFLERLSAYPGGISMDLAKSEFKDAPYLDIIEELLDQALVNLEDRQNSVRISVLSPVRHHLQSKTSEGRLAELQSHAASNILSFVTKLGIAPWSPLSLKHLEVLDPESTNIVFAFRWACAHNVALALQSLPAVLRYEIARGNASRMIPLLDSLRPEWTSLDQVSIGYMELCAAFLKFAFHEESAAHPFLHRARECAIATGDETLLARVYYGMSLYAFRFDLSNAASVSQQALDYANSVGDRFLKSGAYKALAHVATTRHDKAETVALLKQSYDGFLVTESDSEAATTGVYLAHQLWHIGKQAEAASILASCRAKLEEARQPASLAYLNEIEGRFAIDEGRPADAEVKFRESLRLWSTIGSAFQEADQNHSLTRSLIDQGRWVEAKGPLVAAGDLWLVDRNKGGLCCTLALAAAIAFHLGERAYAKELLSFALAFEQEHSLLLMQGELDFRAGLLNQIGPIEPLQSETSLEAGHSMLTVFR